MCKKLTYSLTIYEQRDAILLTMARYRIIITRKQKRSSHHLRNKQLMQKKSNSMMI